MRRPLVAAWAAFSLALVCTGVSQAPLVQSSVPGIMVPPGYDAEIFADTGQPGDETVQLALEGDGNILASSNAAPGGSFFTPVFRLSPLGQVVATSADIRDPDGICVDPFGNIMVGGGQQITKVLSLDGGTDVPFAMGFTNLNWIVSDSQGNFYVSENDGQVKKVDALGNLQGEVYYGALQPFRITAIGPPDQPARKDKVFLFSKTGTVLQLLQVDPASQPPPGDLFTEVAKWTDDEDGFGITFGPDGLLYVSIQPSGLPAKVVTVDSMGGKQDFATGPRGSGLLFDAKGNLLVADGAVDKRIVRIFRVPEFGTGCPGHTGMTPHLACGLDSVPKLGGKFEAVLDSLPATPLTPVIGIFGTSKTLWQGFNLPYELSPFGFFGCTVYVGLDILVPLPQNAATVHWTIPVPNFANLKGLQFYLQAAVIHLPSAHLSLSNAIEGVLDSD